ncbi:MAG: inverse autotransporter beta domain-containing protein [Rhodospirillales bacterium]|nr:inverse autotransporter beta domain-containing protein [Rhodospirillales bacterium]
MCVPHAYAQLSFYSDENEPSVSAETQQEIQALFEALNTTGSAYDSGGEAAAMNAMIGSGCRTGFDYLTKTNLFHDIKPDILERFPTDSLAKSWVLDKGAGLGSRAMSSLCQALQGNDLPGFDPMVSLKTMMENELLPSLMRRGVGMARETGLPFLSNLEIELGTREDHLVSAITTVVPLWESDEHNRFVFSQVAWHAAPETRNEDGYRTQYDTLNVGVAFRYLSEDEKYLYGVNTFLDQVPSRGHNRGSIGIDARTSQLAFSANRYVPISSWEQLDLYNEDRPAAGWDLQLRGQIPELPSWTASMQGYEWDAQDDGEDLFGSAVNLEYAPVSAMAVRMGVRDDSQSNPSFEAVLRFNWRFDQTADLQWKKKTELAPVRSYAYEKVQRENIVRVSVRRQAASKLTVSESAGANTAVEAAGSSSLRIGQELLMPVTVTTGNTVGAYTRLTFAGGATLTLGQNTQVTIVPDLITLSTGTMQYVSDGVITNVVVPGGYIALHGTDIDVVSDGSNSSVRVRDGSVTFTGSISGESLLGPGDMAKSIAGVIGAVASGSVTYITHTDQVSAQIDRVASPLSNNVAPYPYEAPRIISENLTPGQTTTIGLRYSSAVNISGGTPFLTLSVKGVPRTASLSDGGGTNDLIFSYIVQAADDGATNITITGMDENGATLTGNGKAAITTIADTTLTLSGGITDVTTPTGYAAAFTTDPVNNANKTAAAFSITSAEVGSTYTYTISSSGGGANVTGSGTVTTATQNVTGLDVSGLGDGTLTLSLTLTDASSNVGAAVTDTVTKDVVVPYIVSVTPPASTTYAP